MMRTAVFPLAATLWISLCGAVQAGVAIEKVLPFTPEVDSVRIVVTGKGEGELTGTITPWREKTVIWQGSLGQLGANGELEKRLDKLKVKPWSPGAPNLYELTISGGGESKTIRFGFRKFESKNANFHLNGKPIFLRGLAIGPPGRGVPEKLGMSQQFAYDYVSYLKKQHVNIIRVNEESQDWFDVCDELGMMCDQGFYGSPPSGLSKAEEALEKVADKAGGKDESEDPETVANLANPNGGTYAVSSGKRLPRDFERSYKAYKDRFETYIRHPSIVIYILTNEMPFNGKRGEEVHQFLDKMYDRLSAWDHTRLYIGNAGYGLGREGDINDVHRYWGWYYNTFLTFFNLRDPRLLGEYAKNQPMTFSECIGNFTGPNGAYNVIERKQIAAQLCWTGYDENQVEAAQARQAFTNKHVIEVFRRLREQNPRASGLMPFTIAFHNWQGIKSFDQMVPTAAAKQFGVSYSPVLLSLEHFQPQLYAGSRTTIRAHIVNDADDFSSLTSARLLWELRGKNAAGAVSGRLEIPTVAYYGTWTTLIRLELPKELPTGKYHLVGWIEKEGKEISRNECEIFVAASEWKKPVEVERRVVVYDNDRAATLSTLRHLGKKLSWARTVDRLKLLDPTKDTLVVGEEAWSDELAKEKGRLAEFVRAGGRVLCLGQRHDKFDATWLPAQIKMPTVSANDPAYTPKERPSYDQMVVNPQRLEHPIFAGVDRERLKFWSDETGWDQSKPGFPNIYPIRYGYVLTQQSDLARVAILADYDRGLEGVAIAEMFDGKGSVLLCGLGLISRAGLDPVADRMLSNIVQYMASDAPHPIHQLAKSPIRWGDYPSMRGFLSGPVQGFFINTVWVQPPTDPQAKPISNEQGWWNSRPGDQFVPKGIRPRGPFGYSTNCTPRELDKGETGSGIFFAALPSGCTNVMTKVENPTNKPQKLVIKINEKDETTAEFSAGETKAVVAPLPTGLREVSVRYTGSKQLVILETAFK